VWVVLDDDEISSDEDVPLQKRLWLSSAIGGSRGSAPAVADVVTAMKDTADKEATDKMATEKATVKVATDKEATDKRAAEEAAVKEVAGKEAADKRTAEEAMMKEAVVGAARDSSALGQVPSSVAGTKRAAVPSGSTTVCLIFLYSTFSSCSKVPL
jgi:hypothetical protein